MSVVAGHTTDSDSGPPQDGQDPNPTPATIVHEVTPLASPGEEKGGHLLPKGNWQQNDGELTPTNHNSMQQPAMTNITRQALGEADLSQNAGQYAGAPSTAITAGAAISPRPALQTLEKQNIVHTEATQLRSEVDRQATESNRWTSYACCLWLL